ncbi:hypothetical protein [Bacteroides sp.]|uniref:hypothetical protein n=1 Tax=Bacteroides sp. TaxID=29523 RepID=UPI002614BAC8|nr:hypothetical protein [Bacteroides sp.]MDD3039581.1 hypothetical protein [Bacteroides sp.]
MVDEMREARIVVDLIHKQVNPRSFGSVSAESTYAYLSFNNTQLDIEVSVTESVTTGNNIFSLTTWNLPTNAQLTSGDQVFMRFYWMQDVNKFKIYSGIIETVVVESDGQDLKYTFNGALIEDFLMNTLRPRTVSEAAYSNVLKTFGDLQSALQILGIDRVKCVVPGWENLDHILPETDIQIGKKTVLEILQELVSNFKTEIGKDVIAQYNEQNSEILIALDSDKESYGTLTILVLGDEDLFDYRMETVDVSSLESDEELYADTDDTSVDLTELAGDETESTPIPTVMVVKTTGVVGFTRSEIFKYNEHYYITSDVVHSFSDSDGYLIEIYANIVG